MYASLPLVGRGVGELRKWELSKRGVQPTYLGFVVDPMQTNQQIECTLASKKICEFMSSETMKVLRRIVKIQTDSK